MNVFPGDILLAFGWLVIGCLWITAGWFVEARRHTHTWSRFNAPLVMSVAMDIHALGFAMQLSGRIEQILRDGMTFDTVSPIYWLGMGMVFCAKTAFVWVAALGEGQEYSARLIWSYWAAILAWSVFVFWWMQVR